ncbi:MAG: monovalent cation/H+ antiporter subunit D family protein [Desulfonatronovibrionaceae bacterium]
MDAIVSLRPLFAVLVSALIIPVLMSSGKHPNVREAWTFTAAFAKFGLIVSMLPGVLQGRIYMFTVSTPFPGLPIELRVDALGMLFALVASFLWIFTTLYSIGYMRGLKEHGQTRFFSFFALSLSSTIGAAFSANLFTLYLFYEILSLSTYPLVVHHQDRESKISGRKYLGFILGTSVGLVLPAMLICYHYAGTLDFTPGGILSGQVPISMLVPLLLLFVFGFAKAAIMPFHPWLPAAMVAPTPVSALLHAVAVVKVGAFSVYRVITGIFGVDLLAEYGLNEISMYLAGITIIGASLIALSQDNLKRRLAFSTISQLSYIVLGASMLGGSALLGGALHIANHAFMKITLFFCAGAIFVRHKKKNISELDGIGYKMPFTMGAFAIGALGMVGLPPVAGFVSKWYLCLGALETGQILFLIVLLLSSLLNAAYFFPILYRAFFRRPTEWRPGQRIETAEAPLTLVFPLCCTAFYSVVLGIYPDLPFQIMQLAQTAVIQITPGG